MALSLSGLDTTIPDEACSPLEGETRDFSNVIVLVHRGSCDFTTQQTNLAPFGAKYIIFYNDQRPMVTTSSEVPGTLINLIGAQAGEAIVNTIRDGGSVVADFSGDYFETIVSWPNPSGGGFANYFTSFGPTNELFIKPDVAAPGGHIFSTWLAGGWALASGTSMACPYVAGVAALYISKNGGRAVHGAGFAKTLSMRLISSGKSLKWDDGLGSGADYGDFLAPVPQVGTGLIDALKVVAYDTSLSFAKFHLNDTHHFSRYHSVDITNNGRDVVTYSFGLEDSGSVEAMQISPDVIGAPRISLLDEMMVKPVKAAPEVSFPGGTFKVKPGETKTAKFTFNSPTGLDPQTIPIYSGKVIINGSNGESLSVPYMGVAADVHNDAGYVFSPAHDQPWFFTPPRSWLPAVNATLQSQPWGAGLRSAYRGHTVSNNRAAI